MLNHKGTVAIETERLLLRRFNADDAGSMFENWTNDPEVCRYMRWQPHKNVEETSKVLSGWMGRYANESTYLWAITLKGNDEPVGSMILVVVNESDLCGEIAYCIGRKYWGKGITAEALKAVLCFAFGDVGFNRVEAYHSVNNPASGRVMRKAGMIYEGRARQKYWCASGFQDSDMYGIVKEDFKSI